MGNVNWVQAHMKQLKEYHKFIMSFVKSGQMVKIDNGVVESLATFLYSDEIFDFLPVEKVNEMVLQFKNILDISQIIKNVNAALKKIEKQGMSAITNILDEKFKSVLLAQEKFDRQVWFNEIFLSLFLNGVLKSLKTMVFSRAEKNRQFWFFYDFREEVLAISHDRDAVIPSIEKALDAIIHYLNKPVSWESELVVTSVNDTADVGGPKTVNGN